MSGRQTRGRQRIPIRLIENQDDLYATFSKRRLGVYKRASELSTLCGADVGIIIFSPSNNPFSFFSPSMESVLNRYMNPDQQPSSYVRMVENHTRSTILDLNRRLDEVQERKEELKQRERYLDAIDRTRQKGWWEQTPIESLNREQLREWKAWFQNLRSRATNRIDELRNGGSSSSVFQQQNPLNFPYAPPADTLAGGSIFSQDYAPHGATYAPTSETIMTSQFPSQYYVPTAVQYPSIGGETSHMPLQLHVPPQAHNPFVAGSSTDPFQYNYLPPEAQNPPPDSSNPFVFGSSTEPFPAPYNYFPPEAQNPPTASSDPFVFGSSIDPFPDPYNYFPPEAQNPPTGSSNPFVFGSSTDPFPAPLNYFPPEAQNPPGGGGTTQGGPSSFNP